VGTSRLTGLAALDLHDSSSRPRLREILTGTLRVLRE
jgi:hypothetical protein